MLSGSEILEQICDINVTFGRSVEKKKIRKRSQLEDGPKWNKKSIFF
jgi:hypothetical protein